MEPGRQGFLSLVVFVATHRVGENSTGLFQPVDLDAVCSGIGTLLGWDLISAILDHATGSTLASRAAARRDERDRAQVDRLPIERHGARKGMDSVAFLGAAAQCHGQGQNTEGYKSLAH